MRLGSAKTRFTQCGSSAEEKFNNLVFRITNEKYSVLFLFISFLLIYTPAFSYLYSLTNRLFFVHWLCYEKECIWVVCSNRERKQITMTIMYCGTVIYHSKSSLALKSCNLFHPQLLPCVNAAISLNKHRQEGGDVPYFWKWSQLSS